MTQQTALLAIYSREIKTCVYIKTFTRMFIATLFIIGKIWKQLRCSSGGWLNKLVHPYYGILLSNKKEQTVDTHKNLEGSQEN